MDAMYVYLIASSGFFLLGWIVLLLVAYALAFRGDAGLTSSSRNQAGGPLAGGLGLWAERGAESRKTSILKPVLVESHLLEAHAAQKSASPISLPEEVPR
jgi:hypothetical protein